MAMTSSVWGEEIDLLCDNKELLPDAEKCLAYLDDMPADMKKRLAKYLFRYYKDSEQYYDEDELAEWGGITEDNIFEHIGFDALSVTDECRQDIIEFSVSGWCQWEEEHGLEVTVSDGKILYVGDFRDYKPNSSRLAYALEHYGFYDPDADPIMNYADKE